MPPPTDRPARLTLSAGPSLQRDVDRLVAIDAEHPAADPRRADELDRERRTVLERIAGEVSGAIARARAPERPSRPLGAPERP